jgi:hypothetical protein
MKQKNGSKSGRQVDFPLSAPVVAIISYGRFFVKQRPECRESACVRADSLLSKKGFS